MKYTPLKIYSINLFSLSKFFDEKMFKNRFKSVDLSLIDLINEKYKAGIPGWRSGLAPAFGPGCNPGDLGLNPTSGSWCMEPAFPSAYVSVSLCVSLMNKQIKSLKKREQFSGCKALAMLAGGKGKDVVTNDQHQVSL